jgi:glycosyltransferase involved in cell wall biosynthesis
MTMARQTRAKTAIRPIRQAPRLRQADGTPQGPIVHLTAAILASVTPLASVVVPVFNGLPYLRDLVAALLAQDYPNLEIIFSDGGSSDGSLDYLATTDDERVRVITTPKGTTAAANWTAATQAAQGAFIKLICQDDLIEATTISRQAADLQNHPNAVMAIAPRRIIDARGGTLAARRGCQGLARGEHPGSEVMRRCYLQGTNVIGEPLAVLFRRQPLMQCMPWNDANPLMLDVSLYARVAPLGTVVVDQHVVGAFRVSASSWSTRLARVQRQQFVSWQREYEAGLATPPPKLDLIRARLGMERQALTRRLVYRLLRIRGGLVAPESRQDLSSHQ